MIKSGIVEGTHACGHHSRALLFGAALSGVDSTEEDMVTMQEGGAAVT